MRAQVVARLRFGQRRFAVRAQEHARTLAGGNGDARKRVLNQSLAAGLAGCKLARER